jgi:hypothetical protein
VGGLRSWRDIGILPSGIGFLDAGTLRILLALEQKQPGRQLELVDASSNLRQWFEYAGAAQHYFKDGATA